MRKRPSRKPNESRKYIDYDEDRNGNIDSFYVDKTVGFEMVKKHRYSKKRIVSTLMRGLSEGFGIPDCMFPTIICRNGRRYVKPIYSSKRQDWDDNTYIFRTPSYFTIRRRCNDKGNRSN